MTDDSCGLPSKYKILIVDDEVGICNLLSSATRGKYDVECAFSGEEAIELIKSTTYDLVVTDLKLRGKNGIDVLEQVKKRDVHTEVIIITGYASLDSATNAVNMGAASYLIKPVSISNFILHTEKAIASRDFYLRTVLLMQESKSMSQDVIEHISHITEIYEFSKRIMLTLEIPDIVRIFLHELNEKLNASFSVVGTSFFGPTEIFAMTREGSADPEAVRAVISRYWDSTFEILDRENFQKETSSFNVLDGKPGTPCIPMDIKPFSTPMIIMGKTIGSIVIIRKDNPVLSSSESQFVYILASIVAPLMEHGYSHRRARQLADSDPLTGIANHRSFHDFLSREVARADRNKTEFCLLILDVDDFKKVNDTFGHLIGDAVLKDIAHRIGANIRLGDILARYGGEEFAVILPETGISGARVQAERIRKEVSSKPFVFPENEIPYSVSIGISMYSGKSRRSKESLISDADDALYLSKNQGKNCVNEKNMLSPMPSTPSP